MKRKLLINIGDKFNKWTVIKEISLQERKKLYNNTGVYYLCQCDCGNKSIVMGSKLHTNKTKSCGCIKEVVKKDSNLITLYKHYQKSAQYRSLEFSLNLESFKEITSSNCSYCGKIPSSISVQKLQKSLAIPYIYNGIDRIDSNLGYTIDNSVSCCAMCNKMKLDYTKEEFINKAIKIYNFLNIKNGG